MEIYVGVPVPFGGILHCQIGVCRIEFSGWLHWPEASHKDPTVWLSGVRPPLLVLLVLPFPGNEFDKVMIRQTLSLLSIDIKRKMD
jgi:hypothetical protein